MASTSGLRSSSSMLPTSESWCWAQVSRSRCDWLRLMAATKRIRLLPCTDSTSVPPHQPNPAIAALINFPPWISSRLDSPSGGTLWFEDYIGKTNFLREYSAILLWSCFGPNSLEPAAAELLAGHDGPVQRRFAPVTGRLQVLTPDIGARQRYLDPVRRLQRQPGVLETNTRSGSHPLPVLLGDDIAVALVGD